MGIRWGQGQEWDEDINGNWDGMGMWRKTWLGMGGWDEMGWGWD